MSTSTDTNRPWVLDTTVFTHLARAGHLDLVRALAPDGTVLVPTNVDDEIEEGRARHPDIPAVSTLDWVELAVLDEDETWTQLQVKAQLAGHPKEHLGECAVIACAHHRGLVAILDDRAAVAQAQVLGVPTHDTLWIVVKGYLVTGGREAAVGTVDDLLDTGMYLPVGSGESLLAWAYEEGYLP
jgi:predicted nucleic acid-binding protein